MFYLFSFCFEGPLGLATGSATALGGSVLVDDCMVHLPDMGNNWPEWKAQSFGDIDVDNSTYVTPPYIPPSLLPSLLSHSLCIARGPLR